MLKAWYYNAQNGQRLLTVKTIAEYLDCNMETVQKTFDGKIVHAGTGEDAVDAGEVVRFLVRNNLPVASSVLPPNTLKILHISMDSQVSRWQRNSIDLLLTYFKEHKNILAEDLPAGKVANLAILTFTPDVVICFPQSINLTTVDTLSLLSSFPELRTIVVGSESLLESLKIHQMLPDNCLTLSNTLPAEKLSVMLQSVFNRR